MVIDEETKHLIDREVLSKLINNEKIEIGIKLPNLIDLYSIYNVTYVRIEKEQLLNAIKSNPYDLFVFTGTTKDELTHELNLQEKDLRVLRQDYSNREEEKFFILICNEEKNLEVFKQICSNNPNRTAHLIEKKDNKLTWKHSYDASFYISRKLYHTVIKKDSLKAVIDKELEKDMEKKDIFAIINIEEEEEFKEQEKDLEKKDIFAISNIEEEEEFKKRNKIEISEIDNIFKDKESDKKNHVIILNMSNVEKSFEKLCNQENLQDYYNIHWLQNKKDGDNDKLVWKRSIGKIDKIRNLRDTSSEFSIHEDNLYEITNSEKAIILAGEPGMGKSTTLTNLQKQSEEIEWIIKLNLINLQEQLEKISDINNIDSIIEKFFSKADVGVKSGIAKKLLKHRIEHQGKIILLFDGFDEIKNQRNREKVIKLLIYLKDTQAKIQVTTRLHLRSMLENALSVFSYTFQPFSEENQNKFLQTFWKRSFKLTFSNEVNNDTLGKNVESLCKVFYQNISDKKYKFMSIPLLTRIFAEIVENSYHFDSKVESNLLEEVKNLSLSDLFEKFVNRKYEIYFREKIKIENNSSIENTLIKVLNKDHQRLAFHKLFSKLEHVEILADDHKLPSQEEKMNLKLVGIIQSIDSEGDLEFIHQTFAEYFAAGLLFDMIGRRKKYSKYKPACEFLLKNIFLHSNKVIYDFLEDMMQKCDDVLKNKWKAIQDCDLLRKIETKGELKIINPPLDAVEDAYEESLIDLKYEVEKHMEWKSTKQYPNFGYFYNIDYVELINELFQAFLKFTGGKSENFEQVFKFLLDANGKSHLVFANNEFLRNNNIYNAINHYRTQAEKQNSKEFEKEMFLKMGNEKSHNLLMKFRNSNGDKKKKYLENLLDFSIREIEDLKNNNLLHLLNIFEPNLIKDIDSVEGIREKFTKKIIDLITCTSYASASLKNLKILKSFISDQSNIIKYVNEIFEKNSEDLFWLEKKGVLICIVFEILTPEMSKIFSCHLRCHNIITNIYFDNIFNSLIRYIIDKMKTENLSQINNLAFLEILVKFIDFAIKQGWNIDFYSDQVEITLGLIEDMLNKKQRSELEISESLNYLYILGKLGLKIIDADSKLLVLDPAGEFQYELILSNCRKQELIKMFATKLKCDLKRSIHENDLEKGRKRFKSDS